MSDTPRTPSHLGSSLQPRKERRHHYRVDAQGFSVDLRTDRGTVAALAVDASAGGMAVAVSRSRDLQLQRSDRVVVVLVHEDIPPVELPCIVVRHHPTGHDTATYGLRFLDRAPLEHLPASLRSALNRRVSWRVFPRRPVEVEVAQAPAEAYWRSSSTGSLLDVSQVGVGLLLPATLASRFEPRSRVALRFDLPGADATTELTADCVYDCPFADGVRFGARIDYVDQITAGRARTQLREYVMRRLYEDAWMVRTR